MSVAGATLRTGFVGLVVETVRLTAMVRVTPLFAVTVTVPLYGVICAARVEGLAVMVRVAGLVPELGLTDSQLPVLMVVALKFVPLNPDRETAWLTGPPNCCAERLTGLGEAVRPAVEPGASTVTGIVRLVLAALFAVSTILPVLNPGPSWLVLMPTPIADGVLGDVTE